MAWFLPGQPALLYRQPAQEDGGKHGLRGHPVQGYDPAAMADAPRRKAPASAAGVKDRDLGRLAKVMSERTFAEGEAITTEGKSGIGFFVIEDGNATVSVKGEILRTLGPGDHLGEIALIDEGPRSATVIATTDLRCRGMAAWEFRSFVQEHPEVAWSLLQTLAARFRETRSEPRADPARGPPAQPDGGRVPRLAKARSAWLRASPPNSHPVRAAW